MYKISNNKYNLYNHHILIYLRFHFYAQFIPLMKKLLLFIFLISGFNLLSQIQPKSFSLSTDFRSRFECRDGYKRLLMMKSLLHSLGKEAG